MILDRKLNVHQPADRQSLRKLARVMPHRFEMLGIDAHRRQHTRRVARVNTRFFDVLLNTCNHTRRVVSERIDIKLGRVFEKPVD